jgi:serine O-acetyltransferase
LSDEGTGEVRSLITEWVEDLLDLFLGPPHPELPQTLVAEVTEQIAADLEKCTVEDAAAVDQGAWYVFKTSDPVQAIATYRVAHAIRHAASELAGDDRKSLETEARRMGEKCASVTGVDIHPEAEIGVPFRIDHGRGVVIGQQARVGRGCTLLNNVILGAPDMDPRAEEDAGGRRHPTLGNGVKVYAGAKVLGDVTVHDKAVIGTGCVIKCDVPEGCKVKLVSQLQVATSPDSHEVYGLRWPGKNRLEVWGSGLQGVSVTLVDSNHDELTGVSCRITHAEDERLQVEVNVPEPGVEVPSPPRLMLASEVGTVVIMEAKPLYQIWDNCGEISKEKSAA